LVTGVGLVTPLGADRETSWAALLAGRSAAGPGPARAPVADGAAPRAVTLALAALEEALASAGDALPRDPERIGCVVSCSKPLLDGGDALRVRPGDEVTWAAARRVGAGGPVLNVSAACATGLQSLLTAAAWVREGRCDVVLAGAAESSLHPLYLAGFERLGVVSRAGRVRPFDDARDGFVVGEGAAVFVVESAERARRRGAASFGAVAGGDFSCDASHATRFNSGGRNISRSLRLALSRAGLSAGEVDYVSAHGTATRLNDALESDALRAVFGSAREVAVSSTKGATGHLLGAAGAVEAAFCLLALRDGRLPPNLHLDRPLTDALDFVPRAGRARPVRAAAKLSFGFGGTVSAAVLTRGDA
jgi:3-oxoacyl-[acyl-carrier-protein] synthase II